jgi:hypothetical protein
MKTKLETFNAVIDYSIETGVKAEYLEQQSDLEKIIEEIKSKIELIPLTRLHRRNMHSILENDAEITKLKHKVKAGFLEKHNISLQEFIEILKKVEYIMTNPSYLIEAKTLLQDIKIKKESISYIEDISSPEMRNIMLKNLIDTIIHNDLFTSQEIIPNEEISLDSLMDKLQTILEKLSDFNKNVEEIASKEDLRILLSLEGHDFISLVTLSSQEKQNFKLMELDMKQIAEICKIEYRGRVKVFYEIMKAIFPEQEAQMIPNIKQFIKENNLSISDIEEGGLLPLHKSLTVPGLRKILLIEKGLSLPKFYYLIKPE